MRHRVQSENIACNSLLSAYEKGATLFRVECGVCSMNGKFDFCSRPTYCNYTILDTVLVPCSTTYQSLVDRVHDITKSKMIRFKGRFHSPGVFGRQKTSKKLQVFFFRNFCEVGTIQGTNISPKNGILKMIFLFPRWDMLIPWRVTPIFKTFPKLTFSVAW